MRLKTLSAAVLSVVLMSQAYAAGLGKLTVLSGLGQPLRAEIELTAVSAEEIQSLKPKLASVEAFRQANIEFNPALQLLRFAIEQRGARQFIRITSVQPMSEPFVDVLLELNSVNGRLVREYTFLLDPPELRGLQSAQISPLPAPRTAQSLPAVAANPSSAAPTDRASTRTNVGERNEQQVKPDSGQKSEATRARPRPPAQTIAVGSDTAGKQYRVQGGDSLSKIAKRNRSQGVSLDQMLVALYRANPEAFINNNMNRLRAGQIIAIPSADASASVDAVDAQGQVIAQAADFNDYRNKLAGQVSTGAGRKASESRQSASGKIAAKVEETPTPANESLDKLKLSKATPDAAAKSAVAQEEKIAQEKAAAESAARLKDLEKNVGDLQKLLEVRSRDLAARQKAAETLAAVTTPPAAVVSGPAAVVAAVPAAASAQVKPADTTAPPPAVVTPPPVAPVSSAAPPANVAPVTPAPSSAAPVVAAPPVVATPPAAVVVPKAPVAPAAPAAGMFDDPVNNPVVQGGVLLALLLGGLALLRSRRKKPAKDFLDTSMADTGLKTNSLFGSTGGQTVDTNNSVFNSSFAPSPGNLDSIEVDPVAEADVYIAYGRDAQAEEILKEALRTQPERHAVRVKLLEIYSSRKDVRAFESVATELYSLTKGEGEDWTQAATLGLALDPANALYVGGEVPPVVPAMDAPGELFGEKNVVDVGNKAVVENPDTGVQPSNLNALPDVVFSEPGKAIEKSETVAAASAPAENNLDFDLNGLEFGVTPKAPDSTLVTDPVSPATAIAKPASAPMAAPLEFSEAQTAKPAPLNETLLAGLNFDFLDKPSEGAAEPLATTPATTPATDDVKPEATADLTTIGDFSLDPNEPASAEAEKTVASPARPDPLEFDLSGISLELPEHSKVSPMADDLKLPASDRDLGSKAGSAAHQEDFSALDLSTAVMDDDGSTVGIGNNAEMATKIDLAVAYQEIGDLDGARELLDEVLKGGNAQQSEKARTLLARLA